MSRAIIFALALSALAISTGLAAAKGGGHSGGGSRMGGAAERPQTVSSKPHAEFKKMKILHCGKYGRGDGHGGVTMVTVCN